MKEQNPYFSIIIPVYNVAPYLRECLDSVLVQTFAYWEAICVDDGSSDGSGTILDEYAAKDSRFRIYHQHNSGVSAARNKALDEAQGKWLCFLDADDKVECHWLEDIAQGADNHQTVDWIRTSYRDWVNGQDPKPWKKGSPHICENKIYKNVVETVWNQMAFAGMPFLNIYKREVVGSLRFDTTIWFAEDACFSADYMHKSKLLLTIPNDSYRYRLRLDSATHVLKNFRDTANALNNILQRWKTIPGSAGAFTPSVLRHACRCRKAMTKDENNAWLTFLREARREKFFSLRKIAEFKLRLRWWLYVVTGSPHCLFDRFGLNWILPFKWANE